MSEQSPAPPSNTLRNVAIGAVVILLLALALGARMCSLFFEGRALNYWEAAVQAWIDENENGTWDAGELPLAGVKFFADYTLGNYTGVMAGFPTNIDGDSRLGMGFHGSGLTGITIYPEVPAGYRLTTPARVPASGGRTQEPYRFGFANVPGAPTAVPRVTRPISCTAYPQRQGQEYTLSILTIAPDDSLWGIGPHSALHILPTSNQWELHALRPITASGGLRDIAIADDGTVWVGGTGGAASYDGTQWTHYTTHDGLGWPDVVALTPGEGGTVWFAADTGVSRFDPATGQWSVYPCPGAKSTTFANLAVTPDGTVWAASYRSLSKLALPGGVGAGYDWRTYPLPGGKTCSGGCAGTLLTTASGRLWMSGNESPQSNGYADGWIAEFDPLSESWVTYDITTTHGALLSGRINGFELALDGSIWLSTPTNGIIQLVPAPDRDPAQAQVIYYPDSITHPSSALAAGPDGSLWLVAYDRRLYRCRPGER